MNMKQFITTLTLAIVCVLTFSSVSLTPDAPPCNPNRARAVALQDAGFQACIAAAQQDGWTINVSANELSSSTYGCSFIVQAWKSIICHHQPCPSVPDYLVAEAQVDSDYNVVWVTCYNPN